MNELTRLADHVRNERQRAPMCERIRSNVLRQVQRDGSVRISGHFIREMFPNPDQTENFFLAVSKCRPVPSIREQFETWCGINDIEARYVPSEYAETMILINKNSYRKGEGL